MSARAIWKGKLKVDSTTVPVRLYSAVVDRTVHFHILESKTRSRVKQHMVNPETGDEVPSDEIQKGYNVEPGVYVILTPEELEKLEPEASRDIEITRFVSPDQISSQWYDRAYYLGPDGDSQAYFALARALENKNKEAVARWVMRRKQYSGALRADDGYLMLITLRPAAAVISAEDLKAPGGRALEKNELKMARELIAFLEGEFNASEFRDEYRNRVLEFIEKKAKGKKPKLERITTKKGTRSLETVLAKSIAAMKKQKEKAAA